MLINDILYNPVSFDYNISFICRQVINKVKFVLLLFHIETSEKPYVFTSAKSLVADFLADIEKIRGGIE